MPVVRDEAEVRRRLGIGTFAPRPLVAKALGVHDRTVQRMGLPSRKVGQQTYIDLKAAGRQLGLGNTRK
jgi:hypothetical protein